MRNWNHDAIRKAAGDMLKQTEASQFSSNVEIFSQKYLNVGPLQDQYQYLKWYPEIDSKSGFKIVMVHPGSGKSRWVQMEIIRRIAENRNIRIGIASISSTLSHRYMTAVASILKLHQPLIDAFGPFWDSKLEWNTKEIRVLGSDMNIHTPTLMNVGMKTAVEGMRFDLIIGDDIADDKSSLSGADTAFAMERINTLMQRLQLNPAGEIWIFGHRFCLGDVYEQIMEDLPIFQPIILPPFNRDGSVLVPEIWSAKQCRAKLDTMPEWKVKTNYYQIAASPSDAVFDWSWVEKNIVDDIPTSRPIKRTAVADPAYTTNKSSDFSAGWVALPYRNYIIVVGMLHKQLSAGWADRFLDFALEHDAYTLHIEKNNAKTLPDNTMERANDRNLKIGVIGFDSVGNKMVRISRLEPWMRNGKIKFHRSLTYLPEWKDFKAQISMYPHVTHDDLLDSLEMVATRLIDNPNKREKVQYVTPASRYGSPTDGKRPWEL